MYDINISLNEFIGFTLNVYIINSITSSGNANNINKMPLKVQHIDINTSLRSHDYIKCCNRLLISGSILMSSTLTGGSAIGLVR